MVTISSSLAAEDRSAVLSSLLEAVAFAVGGGFAVSCGVARASSGGQATHVSQSVEDETRLANTSVPRPLAWIGIQIPPQKSCRLQISRRHSGRRLGPASLPMSGSDRL